MAGGSVIWLIADPEGRRFWLKRHDLRHKRELTALENWLPMLGEPAWWRSSELVAKPGELSAMIPPNVEGGLLDETGVSPEECSEMFFLAGRFARKLHDARRMEQDHWRKEPRLKETFFDGYGHQPTELAEHQLQLLTLVGAIASVPWAMEYKDARFAQSSREKVEKLRRVL